MITTLLFDLAWVILFPVDRTYHGTLNNLHKELSVKATYRFSEVFEFDEELLNYIKRLKDKYEMNMFTSGTIQEVPEAKERLTGVFEAVFSAEKLGVSKRDRGSYLKVAELMGKKPQEVVFVDDTEANVEAARRSGMEGVVYKGLEDLKNSLRLIFQQN